MNDQEHPRDLARYLQDYNELPFERLAEKYRRRKVVETIQKFSPARVVEVGCGSWSIFHDLPQDIIGTIIEPIPELLTLNFTKFGSRADIGCFLGTLEEFVSRSSEKFDMCVLSSLLHEVDDPSRLLHDCQKILDLGGSILIDVPNALSIHRYVGQSKGIIPTIDAITSTQHRMQQARNAYSPSTLCDQLEEVGLTVVHIETFFPKPLDNSSMQDLYENGVITDDFLERLYSLSARLDPVGSEILAVVVRKS